MTWYIGWRTRYFQYDTHALRSQISIKWFINSNVNENKYYRNGDVAEPLMEFNINFAVQTAIVSSNLPTGVPTGLITLVFAYQSCGEKIISAI